MPISARNQLRGTIEEIVFGTVVVHVTVRVGEHLIESVITRRSADDLDLKKGDTVTALIKATEVMIEKEWCLQARRAAACSVQLDRKDHRIPERALFWRWLFADQRPFTAHALRQTLRAQVLQHWKDGILWRT